MFSCSVQQQVTLILSSPENSTTTICNLLAAALIWMVLQNYNFSKNFTSQNQLEAHKKIGNRATHFSYFWVK